MSYSIFKPSTIDQPVHLFGLAAFFWLAVDRYLYFSRLLLPIMTIAVWSESSFFEQGSKRFFLWDILYQPCPSYISESYPSQSPIWIVWIFSSLKRPLYFNFKFTNKYVSGSKPACYVICLPLTWDSFNVGQENGRGVTIVITIMIMVMVIIKVIILK